MKDKRALYMPNTGSEQTNEHFRRVMNREYITITVSWKFWNHNGQVAVPDCPCIWDVS